MASIARAIATLLIFPGEWPGTRRSIGHQLAILIGDVDVVRSNSFLYQLSVLISHVTDANPRCRTISLWSLHFNLRFNLLTRIFSAYRTRERLSFVFSKSGARLLRLPIIAAAVQPWDFIGSKIEVVEE